MTADSSDQQFVVCIRNDDYPVSLEVRKLYQVIPDVSAAAHQHIRIVDESGEDFLYPASYFVAVDLPIALRERLLRVA